MENKRTIVRGLMLSFILAGSAWAADAPMSDTPNTANANTGSTHPKSNSKKGEMTHVKGTVQSVDAAQNKIEVKEKSNDMIKDFDVPSQASVMVDGKKATLADLQSGDMVTVTCDKSGQVKKIAKNTPQGPKSSTY